MASLPLPRVLPVTILALATLLAMKSVTLVRAAAGEAPAPAQAAHAAAAPAAPPQPAPAAPASSPVASSPGAPSAGASAPGASAPGAVPAAAGPVGIAPAAPASAQPVADGERAVLLDLRERRKALDAREATLAAREATMQAAERKLTGRVAELESLQKRLEALETARVAREDASWQGLVKLYEAMRPRDAAVIFNDLDTNVLLQVVDRMKEAKAAPILAAMQPDKARDLTAKLAAMRVRRDTPAAGG